MAEFLALSSHLFGGYPRKNQEISTSDFAVNSH